ncbi:MAG: SIMPL domain-containing protein, partial [Chloroflexota bacterium]|nr:SIMPL domain-containing protein [Chloroflexota bacterium]
SGDSDDTLRTISVNGVGRVKAEPDVADISLGVTKQGKEAAEAANKAAEAMDSMVTALLDMGIEENDIQTTNLSLSPRYDWTQDPAPIVGWEANNMVSVTIRDIDSVGAVVDAATDAGATNVNGISFRVEDPTEAEATARTAAVADAKAKAEQLAADAGVTITGVVSITESGGQQPQPIYMARSEMAMMDAAGASTPVMPGEVELAVNVFIQYEIQ